MRVILSKRTYAEQAVQGTAGFMAMHLAKLAHAQRQILIGMQRAVIDKHCARAVHRLDGKFTIIDHRRIHIVLIVIPVAAGLPQLLAHHDRRLDELIAFLRMLFIPELLEHIAQDHAIRQKDRHAGRILAHHEQAQLTAQLLMVALLGLFQKLQMLFQLLLGLKAYAVDALQHLVVRIALPVGAGMLEQLEIAALLHRIDMRSAAKIHKFALTIDGDVPVFQMADQIQLVFIVFEHLQRICLGDFLTHDALAILGDLLHLFLDQRQIFIRDLLVSQIHVIVKPFGNDWSDPKLGLRIQTLHRLRHHVRAGMIQLAELLIFLDVNHLKYLQ